MLHATVTVALEVLTIEGIEGSMRNKTAPFSLLLVSDTIER